MDCNVIVNRLNAVPVNGKASLTGYQYTYFMIEIYLSNIPISPPSKLGGGRALSQMTKVSALNPETVEMSTALEWNGMYRHTVELFDIMFHMR